MNPKLIAVLVCALLAAPASADESHHPAEGAPAAAAPKAPPAPAPRVPGAERAAAQAMSMGHMHEMMERMKKAATAEERNKIMEEHKASMKQKMGGGDQGHGEHK